MLIAPSSFQYNSSSFNRCLKYNFIFQFLVFNNQLIPRIYKWCESCLHRNIFEWYWVPCMLEYPSNSLSKWANSMQNRSFKSLLFSNFWISMKRIWTTCESIKQSKILWEINAKFLFRFKWFLWDLIFSKLVIREGHLLGTLVSHDGLREDYTWDFFRIFFVKFLF